MNKVEDITVNGGLHWHPFFENAYRGGGLRSGAGYMHPVSPYSLIDVRGSYSIRDTSGRKSSSRAADLPTPRVAVPSGWISRSHAGRVLRLGHRLQKDDRANFGFQQSHGSATDDAPADTTAAAAAWRRRAVGVDRAGGRGAGPSVETVYTPATLPGLDSRITYLHTQGTVGLDWRPAARLRAARRLLRRHGPRLQGQRRGLRLPAGGLRSGAALPDPARDVGHLAAWACADDVPKGGQEIPFFMLPSLGGGTICVATPAGASAIATACSCRLSGASWSIASWIPRSSTMLERSLS